MDNSTLDYLKKTSAYDFLIETEADGYNFNTRVVQTFLKLKFGNQPLKTLKNFTETERLDAANLDEILNEEPIGVNDEEIDELLQEIAKEEPKIEPGIENKQTDKAPGLWLTPNQIKSIRKVDKALEELFRAFKKGYTDNLPSN